jgi:integrase/recombinase XerD
MSDNNTPLRVIAEVSGHRNLSQLQAYLDVRPSQVLGAVSSLSMLSPVLSDLTEGGKVMLDDSTQAASQEQLQNKRNSQM